MDELAEKGGRSFPLISKIYIAFENPSVLVGDGFPSKIIDILQMQDSSVGGVGWAGF